MSVKGEVSPPSVATLLYLQRTYAQATSSHYLQARGICLSCLEMAQQRFDHVELAFREDKTFWAGLIRTREKANGTEEKAHVRPKTSGRRQVFLICLPGTFWACQKEGVPMMAGGQTAGPWPQLDDNIQANRTWIVMVMETGWNGDSPTRNEILNRSECFDWPRYGADQQTFGIDRIERIKNVGYTCLSNEEIQANLGMLPLFCLNFCKPCASTKAKQSVYFSSFKVNLNTHWGKDHPLLWNRQYFALTLAASILHEHSFAQNRAVLRRIYHILEYRAQDAEFNYMKHKHLACMGGFAAFGILTFGTGVFFCWGMAGLSMASHVRDGNLIATQRGNLSRRLDRLQSLLIME